MNDTITFRKIGVIRTPYHDAAPYQPVDTAAGDFRLVLEPRYTDALRDLDTFTYIYVIYHIDQLGHAPTNIVSPSWTPGTQVGLFASRAPARPNPIGLSVVRVKKTVGNEVITSGLDVFDHTPLLDIKPYIKDLDTKADANYGWLDDLDKNKEHLLLHIQGVPHDY